METEKRKETKVLINHESMHPLSQFQNVGVLYDWVHMEHPGRLKTTYSHGCADRKLLSGVGSLGFRPIFCYSLVVVEKGMCSNKIIDFGIYLYCICIRLRLDA